MLMMVAYTDNGSCFAKKVSSESFILENVQDIVDLFTCFNITFILLTYKHLDVL